MHHPWCKWCNIFAVRLVSHSALTLAVTKAAVWITCTRNLAQHHNTNIEPLGNRPGSANAKFIIMSYSMRSPQCMWCIWIIIPVLHITIFPVGFDFEEPSFQSTSLVLLSDHWSHQTVTGSCQMRCHTKPHHHRKLKSFNLKLCLGYGLCRYESTKLQLSS